MLRQLEAVAVLIALMTALISGYIYLDTQHASQRALVSTEMNLKAEMLDKDIKKDAEARVYYKDIERSRGLEPPEEARLDYLERILDQKYENQRIIMAAQLELKEDD